MTYHLRCVYLWSISSVGKAAFQIPSPRAAARSSGPARLDHVIRIKNNAMRGGVIENIYVRNFEIGQVAVSGVNIDFLYEEGPSGRFTPITRHIDIRHLTTEKAKYALYLRDLKTASLKMSGSRTVTSRVWSKLTIQSPLIESPLS